MGKSYKERPDKYKYQSNKKKSKKQQKSNRPPNFVDGNNQVESYE